MCKDTAKTWIVQEKTLFIESRMSDKPYYHTSLLLYYFRKLNELCIEKGEAGCSILSSPHKQLE